MNSEKQDCVSLSQGGIPVRDPYHDQGPSQSSTSPSQIPEVSQYYVVCTLCKDM